MNDKKTNENIERHNTLKTTRLTLVAEEAEGHENSPETKRLQIS